MPFEFALAMMAAIIVDADTIPKLPRTTVKLKPRKFFICIPVIKEKRKKITMFKENVRTKLKRSFPRKTSVAPAESLRASDVPVSSSLMNTRERPLIAVKKITIQNRPERIVSSTFSSPRENLIMEMVMITNISNELMTYLFFISDFISFLRIEYVCFSNAK